MRPGEDGRGTTHDLGKGSAGEASAVEGSLTTVVDLVALDRADYTALQRALSKRTTAQLERLRGMITDAQARAHHELRAVSCYGITKLNTPSLVSTNHYLGILVSQATNEIHHREREITVGKATAVYARLLGEAVS